MTKTGKDTYIILLFSYKYAQTAYLATPLSDAGLVLCSTTHPARYRGKNGDLRGSENQGCEAEDVFPKNALCADRPFIVFNRSPLTRTEAAFTR